MHSMSNNKHGSSTRTRNEGDQAEPLDRMEELVKLQERRQQRLEQLRELRQGKPASSWSIDLSSNDVKLTAPNSSSPKIRQKKDTRGALSKSLPPSVTPPFVNRELLKKTPSAAARLGRDRSTAPTALMKREESPHPARLLTRMKSVDAPGINVDFSKRPASKTRHSSAQGQRQVSSNTRQNIPNARANARKDSRLDKSSTHPTRVANHNAYESKANCVIASGHNEVIAQSKAATTQERSPSQPRKVIPSKQQIPSLNKLFDNSSDIDYTQSAEELSLLIAAMQAEFETLRGAKAKAEAIADKLRTEYLLQQEETEAQLLSLSSENERLKSTEIMLQVELNQCNEKLNKVEKEKCVLRSRLLKSQNDKISAESKVNILEAENGALHKALADLARSKGYAVPEELLEDIQTSRYATSA